MSSSSTLETNPRGIPKAHFVENVDEYMFTKKEVDDTIREFEDQYRKYKFMEMNTLERKKQVMAKLPEVKSNLQMVDFLIAKRGTDEALETKFELSDTLFATANIKDKEKVYLWLGANVMLEYDLNGARELLLKNKESAESTLVILGEDLDFLSEQIVTLEVNIARIHNWNVKQRRMRTQ